MFITTLAFTAEARAYANSLQTTIALIDGQQLANLMLELSIGVSVAGLFKILRLDEDYFSRIEGTCPISPSRRPLKRGGRS